MSRKHSECSPKEIGPGDPEGKIDRIKVNTVDFPKDRFRRLGFRVLYDYRLSQESAEDIRTPNYERVSRLINDQSGTKIEVEYKPLRPWFPRCRITLVANDWTGLLRKEVDAILQCLPRYSLTLVEFALDFSARSRVDEGFVRQHARFGKSRPHRTRKA